MCQNPNAALENLQLNINGKRLVRIPIFLVTQYNFTPSYYFTHNFKFHEGKGGKNCPLLSLCLRKIEWNKIAFPILLTRGKFWFLTFFELWFFLCRQRSQKMWLLEVEKPVCYSRSIDIIIITKSNDRGEKLMICCLPDWSLLILWFFSTLKFVIRLR